LRKALRQSGSAGSANEGSTLGYSREQKIAVIIMFD
jgi:hypothetical protein